MFEEIITKIKEMFSKDSNEISELIKTLSSHERKVLENKLNNVNINNANYNNEDINRTIKALNIISDIIDNRTNIKDKSIIEMINNMIFELYKMQYDLIDYNCNVLDIDYIISMYAMYALVCDKETMVDKNLRTKIKELKDKTLKEENLNIEHKLYLSILCIVRRINDQNDVNEIKELINTIQDDLNNMQKVEMKNEEIEYTTIMIGIIGNLLYSIQSVAEYIMYGNNKNDNNIYTTIDTYIYNAMQIAEFSN